MRSVCWWLTFVVLFVFASPARAQDQPVAGPLDPSTPKAAEPYFRAGNAAYEAGRYDLAARAFEEAYAIAPIPPIAFSLAQACRRQYVVDHERRWADRALELYRSYIAAVPEGGRRVHAVTHAAGLEVLLAREDPSVPSSSAPARATTQILVISSTPGATAAIDGGPSGSAPAAFEVTPGDHLLTVRAPGHVTQTKRWLALDQRLVVAQVDLAPSPARVRVDAPRAATVSIDGREVTAGREVDVEPGAHTVTVTLSGHVGFERQVVLRPDEHATVRGRLELTTRRRAAHYVFGVGGGLLLGAVTMGAAALVADTHARDLRDLSQRRNLSVGERDDLNASVDRRDDFRTISISLFAASVASGIAGALLYSNDQPLRERASSSRAPPVVAPIVAGDWTGLSAGANF